MMADGADSRTRPRYLAADDRSLRFAKEKGIAENEVISKVRGLLHAKFALPVLLVLASCSSPSVRTPATPASIGELQNVLKDMKLNQNQPAVDAAIARRRKEFLKQQADRLAAANLATHAGFDRVVARSWTDTAILVTVPAVTQALS